MPFDSDCLVNKYENLFFSVSTPTGYVEVGWRFAKKNRESKIMCLLCTEEKRLHYEETVATFVRHLCREHSAAAFWLKLRNYDKMIV